MLPEFIRNSTVEISRWVTLASGWVLEQRKKPLACLPPIEGITLFRSSSVLYLPSCSSSDCSFCWPSIDQVPHGRIASWCRT